MNADLLWKLLAIVCVVVVGWGSARTGVLDRGLPAGSASRALSALAFYVLMPALLFRTTARLDFSHMPWSLLAAFFVPVHLQILAIYSWEKYKGRQVQIGPAAPSVRAITSSFGNTLQVGIPLIAALYGEKGMGLHVAIISIHALTILTVLTSLAQWDLARAQGTEPGWAMVGLTARQTLIHPVVLPVVLGGLVNLTGWGLHPLLDHSLVTLSAGVVPVCLVLIGVSLAHYGFRGHVRSAVRHTLAKMIVFPAMVLIGAHGMLGLSGTTLAVLMMAAALPVGSNPLIFAQRYQTLEGETTAAIVLSTLSVLWVVPFWLGVLALLGTL